MARDAVAGIDAPGQGSGGAVRVIERAAEKASDAADGDAGGQRNGEEIARAAVDTEAPLDGFDRDGAAENRADDRFAAEEVWQIVPVRGGASRIFKPVEDLRPDGCAADGGCD